ncbi:MAG TPA: hypothetical protein VFA84_08075 [Acidimicrobiales bacterium]|nr:hypothetical protein [Acidimicrobiales bacterium]
MSSIPMPTAFGGTGAQLAAWLDHCHAELVPPPSVEEQLRRAGWPPQLAAGEALRYRRRFNEHPLGYSGLLVTTGITALGAGSAGHVLATGMAAPVNRDALAIWLTVFLCALPFAVWSHVWARRVDGKDPVARWSNPRRMLAKTLLWGASIVGVLRLLIYAAQLIGVLVHATWASGASAGEGAVNVAIVVGIALPVALWAYRFLHRFDS